jgi:hypothetical protein
MPAAALDLSVGNVGVSVGGGGASVSTGNTSVGVSTSGGLSGSVTTPGATTSLGAGPGGATAGAGAGAAGLNGALTGNKGSLVSLDRQGGVANAKVNLGGPLAALFGGVEDAGLGDLLAGINLDDALLGPAAGNGPAEQIRQSFDSLSAKDRRLARLTCKQVLASPRSYDRNMTILCKLIARI